MDMKILISLTIILIVIVGIYYGYSNYKNDINKKNNAGEITKEEKINTLKKIEESSNSINITSLALTCYFIDNKKYPEQLCDLTTPIAYMVSIPKDPFKEKLYIQYRKESNYDSVVWLVGPDGMDNEGKIVFDMKNGLKSSGDLVRVSHQNHTE
jgi:hypothetical protein